MPSTNPRAAHKRWHGADSPEAHDARRQLAEANLAAYITKQLAAAPRFEPEQVDRLTALLRGGTGEPAA